MDEYAALAQRVALTLDDVRGCLVLSRDGLVLGAHPEQEESAVKQAWLRFAHVGDPRRSFVEFGDQIWGFVHRGPYTAFIVAGATVRPGILLDQLEQVLLAAEEARTRRDAVKVPDAASAPSGRPRTALHPPLSQPAPAAAAAVPEVESLTVSGVAVPPVAPIPPAVGGAGAPSAAGPPTGAPIPPAVEPLAHPTPHLEVPAVPATEVPAASAFLGAEAPSEVVARSSTSGSPNVTDDDVEAPKEREKEKDKEKKKDKDKDKERDKKGNSPFSREPQPLVSSGWMSSVGEQDDETSDDPAEIDRVMLAKEFSGLLQLDEAGDEGSS